MNFFRRLKVLWVGFWESFLQKGESKNHAALIEGTIREYQGRLGQLQEALINLHFQKRKMEEKRNVLEINITDYQSYLEKKDVREPINKALRDGPLVTLKLENENTDEGEETKTYRMRVGFMRNMVKDLKPWSKPDFRVDYFSFVMKGNQDRLLEHQCQYQQNKKVVTLDELKFVVNGFNVEELMMFDQGVEQISVPTDSLTKVKSIM